jgi:protein gp37
MIGERTKIAWTDYTRNPWIGCQRVSGGCDHCYAEQPRPYVWLGTSAETQKWADIRIPRLLSVPAVVHFVSAEPLLGPLDLEQHLGPRDVSWVITGGKSGAGFRPLDGDWARSIRDQCARAGVAYFHKQGSHRYPGGDVELDGRLEQAWPVPAVAEV